MKAFTERVSIRYFDVAWLSCYDGPGHRVVLFLQGCNLCCPWCHSPHSQEAESPLLYFPARCQSCGRCEQVCPRAVHQVSSGGHLLHRERCIKCGRCIDACPVSQRDRISGALALPTKELTVPQLWHLLYPQLDLVRHIGGLTVSGGEALLQSRLLRDLLALCKKEGFHTAVETSGALPRERFLDVLEFVDCWLYGLRPTPVYTPALADHIADNLAFLSRSGCRIIIRMPVIEGVTDLPESLDYIAEVMQNNQLNEIQLLPYHEGTSHYYHALGRVCPMGEEPHLSAEALQAVQAYFQRKDFSVLIIQ
jgi:glycyl-radical enzyme activating protein